jgi:hypothetical protein
VSRRPAVENLGQPDFVDQIAQLGRRLASSESRLSDFETMFAAVLSRLAEVENGGSGAPTPAPVFTSQPSISPSSGTAGQTFTAYDGTASNVIGYTRRWLLSGVVIGTGATVIPGAAGALVLEVTATGAGGSTIATTAAVTVQAADLGTGTAYPAGALTRTSAVGASPVTYTFTRPVELADADSPQGVMQRSADPTFTTGVTEVTRAIVAATTSYDFGLAALNAGYARLAFYKGDRPASLNWSNVMGWGNAASPAFTSSAAQAAFQNVPVNFTVTTDMPAYLELDGGVDVGGVTRSGNLFTLNYATTGAKSFRIRATSYNGISTVQTVTVNVAANAPNAFTFTDALAAQRSTATTSNTITVAGLQSGTSVPVTVTGGSYSKNGGAYATAATTATNADTFAVRTISSDQYATNTDVTLTMGGVSDTFNVRTIVNPVQPAATFDPAYGFNTLSNGNLTVTGAFGSPNQSRSTTAKGGGYVEFTIDAATVAGTPAIGVLASTHAGVADFYATDSSDWFAGGFGSRDGQDVGAGFGAWAAGDKLGLWVVPGVGIRCYKNGTQQATLPFPAASSTVFPHVSVKNSDTITANYGGTAFTYLPSGATGWNAA